MKTTPSWKTAAIGSALLVALAGTGCSVKQTEEAKLPDVKVTTTDGNLPKYDVDVADVDVRSETKQVEVPDVDVGTKKKTVEVEVPDVDVKREKVNVQVPDVDVTMPGEKRNPD